MNHKWSRELLSQFSEWLLETQGNHPNLRRKLIIHETFFERLDASFPSTDTINYEELLKAFTVAELRKYLLSSQFLLNKLSIEIPDQIKHDQSEKDIIRNKLASNAREPWGALLKQYSEWLKNSKIQPRTIRLYLRAAEKFCQYGSLDSLQPWKKTLLKSFLQKHSSSRASLHKFVTYCRKIKSWDVSMPSKSELKSTSSGQKQPRTIKELKNLLAEVEKRGVENTPIHVLHSIIAKAFGFPLNSIDLSTWRLYTSGNDLLIKTDHESIEVPPSLRPIATQAFSLLRNHPPQA
ncbi:hypothetical protein [Hahella ganghwensis]|uniref:hypothetical protein n=1 Tax=Hahella ganghwensis TaxID=286420 RepID=UPI00036C6A93|nr:hypothetical protein [Hahella ganghwensis]